MPLLLCISEREVEEKYKMRTVCSTRCLVKQKKLALVLLQDPFGCTAVQKSVTLVRISREKDKDWKWENGKDGKNLEDA